MKSLQQYISEHLDRPILEKQGVYAGCEELATYVTNKIQSFDDLYEFTNEELKKFDNIFFKTLSIDVDSSENRGAEYSDDDCLDKKTMLMEEVVIYVYLYEENKDKLKELLMHELTHAFNNYKMLIKKNHGYLNAIQSDFYAKVTDDDSKNHNEESLKWIMYMLLGYEKNAFFAQLKGEYDKKKRDVKGPHDALEMLKSTEVYRAYKKIHIDIEKFFKGELDENDIKEIEQAYEEITNHHETANKIFKKLKALSTKTLEKLDSQLMKLCMEN